MRTSGKMMWIEPARSGRLLQPPKRRPRAGAKLPIEQSHSKTRRKELWEARTRGQGIVEVLAEPQIVVVSVAIGSGLWVVPRLAFA